VCGCESPICACFYNEITVPISCEFFSTYFPVSFTGINGDTDAWLDSSNDISMVYNTSTSLWESYDSSGNLLYTIATSENPPIGDWTVESGKVRYNYLTTSLGVCNPCILSIDGLILAYSDSEITYVPLTWDSLCQCFVSSDGNIKIFENPAGSQIWTLTIYGEIFSVTFDNKSPVGSWSDAVTVLCGNTSISNAEGCLTATGTESEVLYLQEIEEGGFGYGNPFVLVWRIICESGTWYIQYYSGMGGWTTYATATGSCSTPPFSLTWTVEAGPYSSFSFVSGPC
jgi:hypothetical protein